MPSKTAEIVRKRIRKEPSVEHAIVVKMRKRLNAVVVPDGDHHIVNGIRMSGQQLRLLAEAQGWE